jgi:hypothetical protein
MAGEKFTDLPAAAAASVTDIYALSRVGDLHQVTGAKVVNSINNHLTIAGVMLTFQGPYNPITYNVKWTESASCITINLPYMTGTSQVIPSVLYSSNFPLPLRPLAKVFFDVVVKDGPSYVLSRGQMGTDGIITIGAGPDMAPFSGVGLFEVQPFIITYVR